MNTYTFNLKLSSEPITDEHFKQLCTGVKLGWLINPEDKQVEIYLPGQEKQVLDNPTTIGDRKVLPGLVIELEAIWN